jgi:hypothetical protein
MGFCDIDGQGDMHIDERWLVCLNSMAKLNGVLSFPMFDWWT